MHAAAVLALLSLASPPKATAPARPSGGPLTEAERAYCESEVDVLERRQRLFEAQGLSAAEIARKNENATRDLAECRGRFQEQGRRDEELKADMAEATRRAGPNATPLERERAWKEVRRDRLASKSPSRLTPEEKAELAEGMQEELRATHLALDAAHQRDPAFLRVVYSAVACYQGERRRALKEAIASEENLVKLGSGDRTRLYSLRSELKNSEEVLARNAEVSRGIQAGLDRCTTPTVAVLAHCLGVEDRPEAACESEEIQQYLRFLK